MELTTAIIDCDSLIFSAAHPKKTFDVNRIPIKKDGKFVYIEKTEQEMFDTADKILNSILTATNSTGYIAYVKGSGNYRYQINPDYKSDRGKESPPFWKPIKQHLINSWQAFEVNGIEVDDAVNITRLKLPNAFICAIDSDLMGLEGTHYNWRQDKWITTTKEQANYKFWSDMICGTHNCTKGIPGKGPKFVEKLFVDPRNEESYQQKVLQAYLDNFNEPLGIDEFYRNYKSLFILEDYLGNPDLSYNFKIPEVVNFSNTPTLEW